MARHLLNQSKFGGILNLFLNLRLLLNRFQPRSVTVLAGPACQRPPPRCLAFFSTSRTPSLPTGSLCRPIPPVSRAAPRRLRPTGLLYRATAPLPRPTLPAVAQGPPLPPSPAPTRHRADPHPPPFSLAAPRQRAPSIAISRQPRSPSSPIFFSIRSARY
jgi:hypothetical protein